MSLEFSPRDELEARITALLLGELSGEEEAQLRTAMAQDAELAQLHERLARTIGLVREAAGSLNDEATTPAEPMKLSSERREKLIESFKIVRPKKFAMLRQINWREKRRELGAIAAMVAGLLVAVAVLNSESVDYAPLSQRGANDINAEFAAMLSEKQNELASGNENKFQVSGQLQGMDSLRVLLDSDWGEPPKGGSAALDKESKQSGGGFGRGTEVIRRRVDGFSAAEPAGASPATLPSVLTVVPNGTPTPAPPAIVPPTTLAQNGKLLLEAGKYDLAESTLRRALQLEPENAAADYYLKLTLDKKSVIAGKEEEVGHRQKILVVEKNWADSTTRELLPVPNAYVAPASPAPISAGGVPPVADAGVSVNFGDGANAFGANAAKPRFTGVAPAQAAAASSESVVSPARHFAAIALPKGGDDGLAAEIGGIKEGALGLAFDSGASQDFGIPPLPQAGFTILGTGVGGVGGAGGGAAPGTSFGRTTFKPEMLTDLNRNGDGSFGAVKDGSGRSAFGQRLDQVVSRAAIAGDTMTDLAQKPAGAPKKMDDESGRPALIPGLTPAAPAPRTAAHFDAPDARGDAVKAMPLIVADPATRFVNGAEISRPLPAPVSSPAAPVATAGREKAGAEISAASKFANSEYHFEAASETPRIELARSGGALAGVLVNAGEARVEALDAPQRNPVLHPKKEDTSKLAPDQTATLGGVALRGYANVIRRRVASLETTEPDTAAVGAPSTDPAGESLSKLSKSVTSQEGQNDEWLAAGRMVESKREPAPLGATAAPAAGLPGNVGESFFITTVTNGSAGAVTLDAPHPVTGGFGFVGLGDGSAQQVRAKGLDPKSLGATTALSTSGKSLDFDGMGEPPRDWFQAKSQTFDAGNYAMGTNKLALVYAWGLANTNNWGGVTAGLRLDKAGLGFISGKDRILGEDILSDKETLAISDVNNSRFYRVPIALPTAQNPAPAEKPLRLPSIVINETQSHPPETRVADQEFVELKESIPASISGRGPLGQAREGEEKTRKELADLIKTRDALEKRIWQENVENVAMAMPRESIVEVIDRAEPASEKKPSIWGKVGGLFDSGTERSVRLAVGKDGTDIETINGPRAANNSDPFWIQTESEKIQSKEVLSKVIEKLNLTEAWAGGKGDGAKLTPEATLKRLKDKIDVRSDPKTQLLEIRAKGDNSEEAARLANTIADVYRDTRLDRQNQLAARGLERLKQEMTDVNGRIARAQQAAGATGAADELNQKLDSIRIKALTADHLPLAQVLRELDRKIEASNPQNKGVKIRIESSDNSISPDIEPATGLPVGRMTEGDGDIGAATVNIGDSSTDLSLREALDKISKSSDRPIELLLETNGIVVRAAQGQKQRPAESVKTFRIDSDVFQNGLQGVVALDFGSSPTTGGMGGGGGVGRRGGRVWNGQDAKFGASTNLEEQIRRYLASAGITLNSNVPGQPPGVSFNARTGDLVLRGSSADLELAEQAMRSLSLQKLDPPVRKPAPDAPIPQPEIATVDNAFSTFSLNVSDVSFKLAAAALEKGQMPEPATVRSEEFINAFDYRDPEPVGSAPVAFAWERARYPFAHNRDLLRFSIKTACSGRQPGRPLNLVLLLDNSGSMERADRVRIIRECLRVLASQLRPEDRVSIVAFARTARLWIDNLPGNQAGELVQRVGELTPQGGTNLEEAMNLAYQTALKHFLANGVNRVVLLTDGAANLGDVNPASLKRKVEAHRQQGVALDCFGIGWDGFNDDLLETLSRNGDGRYGFVNSPEAAATEFAGQLAGALHVAASDVKVQVEFNPKRVRSYRQIGYAKHQLKKEQFRDNTVDAAEIAAAEAGNALYTVEVNPAGEGPLAIVRVRFRIPGTADYREHEWAVPFEGAAKSLEQSSATLRLAGASSAFSEWLVSSPFAGEVTPDRVLSLLSGVPETFSADPRPKKLEWMVRQARSLAGK